MIYTAPTNPRPVVYSDSATLYGRHFTIESLIVQSGANKTFTLPTPTRELAGKATWFSHYGTGTLTLSGAFNTGSSHVMDTKTTQLIVCLPVASSTYKFHAIGGGGAATGLSETIADAVGSMVTGNTETYIAVSYQDSDNTLDFVVDATATPTASKIVLADGTGKIDSGWIATATASVPGLVKHATWAAFTDGGAITYGIAGTETFVFTTAAPATPTTVYRYRYIGNSVEVAITMDSADGNDGVPVSVKLPVAPTNNASKVAVVCNQLVNTTWAVKPAYIDTTGSLITIYGGATCTDSAAMALSIFATYEVT